MAPVYATLADLRSWLGVDPGDPLPNNTTDADATRYLRQSSNLVTRACSAAVYATTDAGVPTDATKAAACQEATLTQTEAWIITGLDPAKGTGQVRLPVQSKSASSGGLSVTYGSGDATQMLLAGGTELIPAAWDILAAAGLLTTAVQSGGAPRDTFLVGTRYSLTTGQLEP